MLIGKISRQWKYLYKYIAPTIQCRLSHTHTHTHVHTQQQLTPCCRHCKASLLSTFTSFFCFRLFMLRFFSVYFASLFLWQTCRPLFRLVRLYVRAWQSIKCCQCVYSQAADNKTVEVIKNRRSLPRLPAWLALACIFCCVA